MTNQNKETSTEIEVSKQNRTVDNQIIPQENSLANDYDIDGFLEKRQEFIEKVNKIMVKGSDYHEIKNKKSLAKGGAEKIASIFGWTARFEKDQDITEAFREIPGLISFVCKLAKGNIDVGEGRGAAILSNNGGDPNKTIKMGQKSAFIDAVLRASGLSDFFTQDLEDMNPTQILDRKNTWPPKVDTGSDPNPTYIGGDPNAHHATVTSGTVKPISQKQALFIKSLRTQKGLDQVPDDKLRKLSSYDASIEIKRLQELLPEIDIRDPENESLEDHNKKIRNLQNYQPNHEGD